MSRRPPGSSAPKSQAPARSPAVQPLTDDELLDLDERLASVPEPLEALSASALDGFLCGVLLQPRRVPPSRFLAWVTDTEGRPLPETFDALPLHAAVLRRHAELDAAIQARRWFDPWVFAEPGADVTAVDPWVTGFTFAMECFPALIDRDDPELTPPLALVFRHVDPADLEDADDLLEEIESLEPLQTLEEAIEHLVRATLQLADLSRPLDR